MKTKQVASVISLALSLFLVTGNGQALFYCVRH